MGRSPVLPEDGVLRHQDGVLVPGPGFPLAQHTASQMVYYREDLLVSTCGLSGG